MIKYRKIKNLLNYEKSILQIANEWGTDRSLMALLITYCWKSAIS